MHPAFRERVAELVDALFPQRAERGVILTLLIMFDIIEQRTSRSACITRDRMLAAFEECGWINEFPDIPHKVWAASRLCKAAGWPIEITVIHSVGWRVSAPPGWRWPRPVFEIHEEDSDYEPPLRA